MPISIEGSGILTMRPKKIIIIIIIYTHTHIFCSVLHQDLLKKLHRLLFNSEMLNSSY